MRKGIALSTYEGIEILSQQGELLCAAPMKGAGALCAGREHLFCAGENGEIWRLDCGSLLPQMVFRGGPGICDLKISSDGVRLYALLGDCDSILLCDAHSAKPLVVNRCGCNPRCMVLHADVLAAAGGESGCIHLYDPHTLHSRDVISMQGPVYGVAVRGECVYALCLTADLNSLLIMQQGAKRAVRALEGMPGCLHLDQNMLFAATQGFLYAFSAEDLQLLMRRCVPGRASTVLLDDCGVFLFDPLSECVWLSGSGSAWRILRNRVRAMASCPKG